MKFNFSPFPTFDTNRLKLRQTIATDCNDILFLRSNTTVNQYINRDTNITIDDAREFLHKTTTNINNGESIDWAIRLKDKPKMIGSLCLWNFSDDGLITEVGYALKPEFQNKAIMYEAILPILRYGFDVLKVKEIVAYTQYNNKHSIKLLTKLGFSLCKDKTDEGNPKNRIYSLIE